MTSRVSLLSSTAIAAAAIVFAGASASAASMDALEKRVKALEKAGAGKSVSRSKKTMKLTVSGHLNRQIQYVDDGVNSEFRHTTNQQSRSRVRWVGTGKLTDDISVRTLIEFGNSDAISSGQSLQADEVNGGTFDTRHIDLQLTSKSMGKLYLGHGSEGGDGVTGAGDLSGTLVALSGGADESLTGSASFRTTAGAVVGVTTRNGSDELDGGRIDRVRYDTPKFAGFQLRGSHGNQDVTSVALQYGGSFSGVKVKAAIGYKNDPRLFDATQPAVGRGDSSQETVNGSIGVLLPMGLSFQFAAGSRDFNVVGVNDADMRYGRIGYRFKGSELGETRLAIAYNNGEDFRANGDDLEVISAAVVQIIEPLGAELYAVYNNYDLERTGTTNIEDIDMVSVGLRVKF
jgi:hypothetical protein